MNKLKNTLATILFFTTGIMVSQNTDTFPGYEIDSAIIAKRGLEDKIKMLQNDCDWANRVGKKIDLFWLQTTEGNYFGKVYEYFLDCDNVRLIYWYDNPACTGLPVDFMVEDLEEEIQTSYHQRKSTLKIKRNISNT